MTRPYAEIAWRSSPVSSDFLSTSPTFPNFKMHDALMILANVALPICAGVTFFALARYSTHIAPMRQLVTGEMTYKGAMWGFAFFGVYLITRPLQILLG